MKTYTFEQKRLVLDYLLEFVTDHKRQLFSTIIENRTRHMTVVLEDIFQPHNASAVLRSCDCFGVHDVHIIENRNLYTPNPQVSLGSSKWLNLKKYNDKQQNTLACFEHLREQGYTIVATSPHKNDCLLEELPVEEKTALVFGTELEGLSQIALDHADRFVRIPMYGFTESFNISVSAALSMFYLTEKIRHSDIDWRLTEEEKLDVQLTWARTLLKSADQLEQRALSDMK